MAQNSDRKFFLYMAFIAFMSVSCASLSYENDAFYQAQKLYDEKNYLAAKKQLISLADSGNSRAQNLLGNMFFFGLGVEPDYDTAFKWRRKAAEQRLPEAQYYLAGMYLSGHGVQKDVAKAIALLIEASNNNHSSSSILLGQLYEHPLDGSKKNLCKATKWYRSATEMGDPLGHFMLNSVLFNSDDGVKCE